jgi:hypothetical protein
MAGDERYLKTLVWKTNALSRPLLELANYHALGRILYYVPYEAPLNPGRTLTTFGMLSTLVEILNGLGVAWIANPALKPKFTKTGSHLLEAGLILQLFVIVAFCGTAGLFQYRCAKAGVLTRKTRGPLITMYISSMLIMVRCIYRTVEYFSVSNTSHSTMSGTTVQQLNHENPIVRYEWFFYVFEAMVLLLNEFLWNVRHPRHYLPQDYHIYLAQDGVTELEGPGYNDKRPLILTVLDPFDWIGSCAPSKNKNEIPFWEKNGFGKEGHSPASSRSPDRSRGRPSYTSDEVRMTPAAVNPTPSMADPTARTDHRNVFIILLDPLGWIWKKK